jgi:hypothetical protein
MGVTTVRDLLETDLKEAKGVGPATEETIRMSAMSVLLSEHSSN